MRPALVRYRYSFEQRIVHRFPLVVFFGLALTIPLVFISTTVGVVAAESSAVDQASQSALTLISGEFRDEYRASLSVIQKECESLKPLTGLCFTERPPASVTAVTHLRQLAANAHLAECVPAPMPVRAASGYDYLGCLGAQSPNWVLSAVWVSLFLVGALCMVNTVSSINRNRSLLPRFNRNLWLTPYATLATLLSIIPFVSSWLLFRARVGTSAPGGSLNLREAALWALVICSLIGAVVVADLRTFPPDRIYIAGIVVAGTLLFAIFWIVVLIGEAITASDVNWALLVFTMALCVLVAVACIWLSRRPYTKSVMRSTLKFMRRLLTLASVFLIAAAVLLAHALGFEPIGENTVPTAWSLWAFGAALSLGFERGIT